MRPVYAFAAALMAATLAAAGPATSHDVNHQGRAPAALRRAITAGIDAQGVSLSAAMPRYRMQPADLDALIGFLRSLDEPAPPGVTGQDIRIATLLRLRGRLADTARAVERFLDLPVPDVNTRRRFEGRRITRVSIPFDADVAGNALRAAQAAIATEPPFAFLSNYYGAEPELAVEAYLDASGVPNLAPLAAPEQSGDKRAIWIEPSVAEQAEALVAAAAQAAPPWP